MPASLGTWSAVTVGGHPCDIYEPPRMNEQGFAGIYLHGVHQTRLIDNGPFTAEFARHGLPVIVPLTGESWWADRVSPAFDPQLSAEAHVLLNVLPYLQQRWQTAPPRIALFGTSMGGQGRCDWRSSIRRNFPLWRPFLRPSTITFVGTTTIRR